MTWIIRKAYESPFLHVSDLDLHLREQVKQLTNGAQTPVTTIPKERLTNPKIFLAPSRT